MLCAGASLAAPAAGRGIPVVVNGFDLPGITGRVDRPRFRLG
jgi:hypothetical protein